MKLRSIAIGITDREMNLIGFKGDTFWSITEFPKIHSSNENHQIDTHLIPNLLALLNNKGDKDSGPLDYWMGHKELFIAIYDCPSEGDGFVYPKEAMREWLKNIPEPTILYRVHRDNWTINGIKNPWIADPDLTLKIETIDPKISLN